MPSFKPYPCGRREDRSLACPRDLRAVPRPRWLPGCSPAEEGAGEVPRPEWRPDARGKRGEATSCLRRALLVDDRIRGDRSPVGGESRRPGIEGAMLYWAAVFFIISLIAGLVGFTGISAAAAEIAKLVFFIFLVLFIVSLVASMVTRGPTSPP